MAHLKTQKTKASVKAFLDSVDNDQRRQDALEVKKMMGRVTGYRAKMWGDSIIGFGSYAYKYESGREGEWFLTGLSPRKQALTVYIMPGFSDYGDYLDKLGAYKTSKSCLYIKKLEDVDRDVLEALIAQSVADLRQKYKV